MSTDLQAVVLSLGGEISELVIEREPARLVCADCEEPAQMLDCGHAACHKHTVYLTSTFAVCEDCADGASNG